MFKNHFLFAFLILQLGIAVAVLVTLISDKGGVPFYAILLEIISFLYAIVFSVVANRKNIDVFPAGYAHIITAMTSVLLVVLFYSIEVDWLSINNGARMSLLQRIVHSDITIYLVYALGCILAVLMGVFSKDDKRS